MQSMQKDMRTCHDITSQGYNLVTTNMDTHACQELAGWHISTTDIDGMPKTSEHALPQAMSMDITSAKPEY